MLHEIFWDPSQDLRQFQLVRYSGSNNEKKVEIEQNFPRKINFRTNTFLVGKNCVFASKINFSLKFCSISTFHSSTSFYPILTLTIYPTFCFYFSNLEESKLANFILYVFPRTFQNFYFGNINIFTSKETK